MDPTNDWSFQGLTPSFTYEPVDETGLLKYIPVYHMGALLYGEEPKRPGTGAPTASSIPSVSSVPSVFPFPTVSPPVAPVCLVETWDESASYTKGDDEVAYNGKKWQYEAQNTGNFVPGTKGGTRELASLEEQLCSSQTLSAENQRVHAILNSVRGREYTHSFRQFKHGDTGKAATNAILYLTNPISRLLNQRRYTICLD